jgi:hypothetical protein
MAVFCNFKSYGTLVLLVCYDIAIAMFVTSRVTHAGYCYCCICNFKSYACFASVASSVADPDPDP